MKRRTILITVGSIFAAGCSQGNPSHGNGQGVYQSGKGVGNISEHEFNFSNIGEGQDFDIEEIEHTFDFNSSQLGSDVTFDFGEEDSTRSREQLPTPAESDEAAAGYLEEARQNLVEAINIYARFGGAEYDITAVSPTTESFSSNRVRSKIRNTRKPLLRASRTATDGQKVLILALEQVGIFLKHAALTENKLQDALSEYETGMEYLENADTTNTDAPIERLNTQISAAKDHLDVINSETDGTSMQIIESSAQNLYEAKIAQFDTLVESFNSLGNAVDDIGDGLIELEDGVNLYLDRSYDSAEFHFGSAASSLRNGKADIEDVRSGGVLRNATSSGLNFATTLLQISEDLQQSTQAKLDHDDDTYTDYRDRAIEHLRSDERTRYMAEINRIQW